jgi:hypothetical protein
MPKGIDWVKQYLPDDTNLAMFLFVHWFYSIAAPLILSIYALKRPAIPFISAFVTVTVASVFFHSGYDLASDAQAAVGLIFIPIYVCVLGLIGLAAGRAVQFVVHRKADKAIPGGH